MNKRTAGTLTLIASFCFWFTGCTQECGTWDFTGGPTEGEQGLENAFLVINQFTFTPADCGKTCWCKTDVMIQMTWVYDVNEHKNVYPSGQSLEARNAKGWSIDQVNGHAYGYYGLQNDGTFDMRLTQTGSNGYRNMLMDGPGSYEADIVFYAVDVAVCYDSDTCKNRILGYYLWSFFTENLVAQKAITVPAWKGLDTEFQNALAAWNAWAPGSGPENDGTDGTIPNAIAFPALSDL